MATETTRITATTALILATFALVGVMTIGGVGVLLPAAFAQDGDLDQNVDQETGMSQVADATAQQNEGNRQGNLISLAEELLNTNTIGGGGSIGGGASAGAIPGLTSDSRQGQTVDNPSQGNGALFGDDLGISTALNAAQVNVDLRNLVSLTPPSSTTEANEE
jgi:hypothetical protein